MKTNLKFLIGMGFLTLLMAFTSTDSLREDMITASITCDEQGSENGTTYYQYEVTLTNNTGSNQTVDYTVYMKSGSVIKESHNHSTLLIPYETVVETHESTMSDGDWALISGCTVEWEVRR